MTGSVINPAPRVIKPVRTGRVHSVKVPVHPRQTGEDRDAEPTNRQEPSNRYEENCSNGYPNGARENKQRREEDQAEDCCSDGQADEEKKNRTGYEKG